MSKNENDLLHRFGDNLAMIRAKKGLSVRQLALQCEVSYPNISRIENGRVNPTLTTLVELSKGLGVHPKALLDIRFED